MPESCLQRLNKEQQQAVEHKDGPVLIVAGAGTGKTTVLISRLAYLINNKLAKPEEVLLLTFTEKATQEMEDRALKILPYGCFDLWINTFHGFCERILRAHALDIGLNPDFKILSQTEQWILLKKNLDKLNLDYYRPLGNPDKFIYEIVKHFSRLKDEAIKPEEYLNYTGGLVENKDSMLSGKKISKKKIKENDNDEDEDGLETVRLHELANAFHIYNQLLLESGYLDFGDLINYTIKLFNERPNILKQYREQFKYIMIDEFQDTNWAQYELIKILAAPANNLLVVGDDDQSIYKFRGASLSNIMQYKDDFPKAKKIVLVENYRSGQKILAAAYNLIANNNPNRLEVKLKINKKLKANAKQAGEIKYYWFGREQRENQWVAEKILALHAENKDMAWSDFAILVRANDTAEQFIAELTRHNIPNLFVSLRGLYYKPIIVDIIAYLKLLDNYHESSALFRVLNMEAFKVSHLDIVNINRFAQRKNWSLFEALKNISAVYNVSAEGVANINKLLGLLEKHAQLARTEKTSKVFVRFIWDAELNKKDYNQFAEYYSYLNQFYQKIKKFEEVNKEARLKDFMELLELEREAGETGALKLDFIDDDTVKIMTVHGAKGLEFKYVFVANLVDKKFPTISRKEKIPVPDAIVREKLPTGNEIHLEEERRLFYVAMTRAKEKLFLTGARDCGGAREKKPSLFIAETGVDTEEIEQSAADLELIRDLDEINKPFFLPLTKYQLPDKYSFSQIEAFSNCPLQYKFNFLLKIPVLPKAPLVFGRTMHNTVRDFMLLSSSQVKVQAGLFADGKDITSNARKALADLEIIYKNNWQEEGYDSKEEEANYKKKGWQSLKIFFEQLESDGYPDSLYLEKSFFIKIGDYIFKGMIDRVDRLPDGSLEIIDYKTGSVPKEFSFDKKKQLLLYQIALEEGLGLKVLKLSYYYFDGGQKKSFTAQPEDIEKLKQGVIATIAEIEKCVFMPKPSLLCGFCDFRGICEYRST